MEPEVFISYNHMAEGAGLWSKVIGTAQIVLGVRWPLADSQETIPPLVTTCLWRIQNENIRERKSNKYPICISVIFQLAMFFLNMAQQLKLFMYL